MTTLLERDLSLLLELCLAGSREDELDAFTERFVERALERLELSYGLLFLRRELLDGTISPSERSFVPLPRRRAASLLDPSAEGTSTPAIEAALTAGRASIRPADASALAHALRPEVPQPSAVISLPIADLGLLELATKAPGTIDEHTCQILASLAPFLEQACLLRAGHARAVREAHSAAAKVQALEQLLTDIPSVVWHASAEGQLVYVSPQVAEVLGVPLEATAELKDLRSSGIRDADRERVNQELADARRARRREVVVEYRFWLGGQAKSRPIDVEERITLRYGPSGEQEGEVGIICDVTLSRMAQRRIDELNSQRGAMARADALRVDSVRATRAKTEFLNLLSHELRAPLFPIIALSDLLLRSSDQEIQGREWRQQVEMIGNAGKHMLQLVGDLLDISRVDAGKLRANPGPLNVPHFIDALAQRHQERARALGATLTVKASPKSSGIDVYTDRTGLERIAAALIAHSLENMQAKRLELTVEVGLDRIGLEAKAEIAGALPTDQDEIFEPFWEVPGHARPESRGHGLALALVRRLAHSLGGKATARAEGGCQIISAELPCALSGGTRRAGRAPRVLLGAAELRWVFGLALELMAAGADVLICPSAGELVAQVRQGGTDLLLVDLRMPGLRVLEELLQVDAQAPGPRPTVVGLSRPGEPGFSGTIALETLALPASRDQLERLLARASV